MVPTARDSHAVRRTGMNVNLVLSQNRLLRLCFVCAMYLAQGIPFGFVTSALKTHLIAEGAGTAEVGVMIAMVSWPWALKWIFGPIIDRFSNSRFGRRRPWIILAQGMMLVTIAAMLFIDIGARSLTVLSWLVLAHNVFAALQDVSTDALAIDLIPEHERGRANGFMYGCAYVGRFFGGYLLGMILFKTSIAFALAIMMILLALIFLLPLLLRERETDVRFPWSRSADTDTDGDGDVDSEGPARFATVFRHLFKAFCTRAALAGALIAILAQIGGSVLAVVGAAYLQNVVGWTREAYLGLEGVAVWAGLAGSLAGGWLADKTGARRMVMIATAAYGSMWFLWFALKPFWDNQPLVYALTVVETALQGGFAVSMFAWFMSLCDKHVAATQFTAYMAILNLSIGLGSSLAGWTEATLGFPAALVVLGAFQVSLAVIPWLAGPRSPVSAGPADSAS